MASTAEIFSLYFSDILVARSPYVIIFSDNILYKVDVMSYYNKKKLRTAVTHLRQYIKETTENPELETEILEVGDGLAITKKRIEK